MSSIYSVLLIEDDTHTRDLLASIVNGHTQLKVNAAVGTCKEGLCELEKNQPDVLLIDLGLPDGDGTELIREVYSRGYTTDAMVITVFGDEKHVIKAIEAGAYSETDSKNIPAKQQRSLPDDWLNTSAGASEGWYQANLKFKHQQIGYKNCGTEFANI